MTRRKVGLVSVLVVLLLGAAGFIGTAPTAVYRPIAPLQSSAGELLSTISATGTLNAVVTVQVGTQVSGTIQQLLVDFKLPVKKGMLIARIDPAILEAKCESSPGGPGKLQGLRAAQRAAWPRLGPISLTPRQTSSARRWRSATQDQAGLATRLFGEGGSRRRSATPHRRVRFGQWPNWRLPKASVNSSQAALEVPHGATHTAAEAQVRQKQACAGLLAEVDLRNTLIRRPCERGRSFPARDVGADRLRRPATGATLFLIAQDLTKMQVDTTVDEATSGGSAWSKRRPSPWTHTLAGVPGRIAQIRQRPQVDFRTS